MFENCDIDIIRVMGTEGALTFETWFFEGGFGGTRRNVLIQFDISTV